jgi:hypothetical protein
MTKPNTLLANHLGKLAFANGIKGAPCLDKSFMKMIAGRQVGDARTIQEMRAWAAGWTAANLAKS